MNCPNEIVDILLEILARGVVQARAEGWSGKLEQATLEADHVHNLPDLVRRYDPEKLVYYWDRERPSYISRFERLNGAAPTGFVELWARLEALMPEVRSSVLLKPSRDADIMERLIRDKAAEFAKRNALPESM